MQLCTCNFETEMLSHSLRTFLCLLVAASYIVTGKLEKPNCLCGESLTDNSFELRIFGGKYVDTYYPWMVFIEFSNVLFCGGALINDLYVLTADHCFKTVNLNFKLYIFPKNRMRDKGVRYSASKVIRYRNQRSEKMRNEDIILIKLAERVKFNSEVYPICLPNPKSNYHLHEVTVIGFGVTEEGGAAQNLKEATLTTMTDDWCRASGIGKHYLPKLMLCAFKEGVDACHGDSGGPLVYNAGNKTNPKYELAGLVSWGGDCTIGLPGVYTKVSQFADWIVAHTADANYCSY